MMARRIRAHEELDTSVMSYWKVNDVWLLYIPGCGAGELRNHAVIEHEDGTISVSPSILMHGHSKGERTTKHGYLVHGEWRDC